MEKLRKSLKAYVIALVLFVALTFALAALVNFTGFREDLDVWVTAGDHEYFKPCAGNDGGKDLSKTRSSGWRRSGCFLSCYHSCVGPGTLCRGVFSGETGWLYLIPVAAGSLGGICGVNHKT